MAITYNFQALSTGHVQVQVHESVQDSQGIERALPPHAYVLEPGMDLSSQPEDIRRVCEAWWTPDMIATFSQPAPVED